MKLRHSPLLLGALAPGAKIKADILTGQQYDYSFQLYQEDADRIRVESHYIRGQVDLTDNTQIRFQWLNDAISGASPTGAQPGGLQPFIANVEDIREGVLGALTQKIGNHTLDFEMSRSDENDYTSRGYALSDAIELNQKNTTVAFGVNFLDDNVKVPGLNDKSKQSLDVFAGVTQIIDKNTLITANVTLGWSDGYLNDPYKIVQRDEIITTPDTVIDVGDGTTLVVPGVEIPVVNIYRENRPNKRFRQVYQLEGKHYFEGERATLDGVFRFSHDDYGVNSETVQVEWQQEFGEHVTVVPFIRYYHQNAARFFVNDLNKTGVAIPMDDPDGTGPNYSADYRLSSFDSFSIGARLRWAVSENMDLSATYERYTMKGTGVDSAPSQAYPSANLFTVGMTVKF